MMRIVLFVLAFFTVITHAGTRTELPLVAPEEQGFNAVTLQQMEAYFQGEIDAGRQAGMTTLIARKGEVVHFKTYGQQDAETPMQDDTLFRIYSMTKPVTSVAMMMLWEEGKFKLDDPVSKYLPSYKNQTVFVKLDDDGSVVSRPVSREATILDLMRHTAGLSYGFMSNTPVDKMIMSRGVFKQPLHEAIDTLGQIPLLADPGEKWVYSLATDVQGRLIEVITGQRLDVFFQERIFSPLGMKDTVFTLKESQFGRLSELYTQPKQAAVIPYRGGMYRDYQSPPISLSGGGGLVSSTYDYWRFAQMLANKGELDGVRLLKPATVSLMTRDHLPEPLPDIWANNSGQRYGLNVAIVTDVDAIGGYGRVGAFGWWGMANTLFWVDPEEDIVAILMVNIFTQGDPGLRTDMRRWVYSALENVK